MNLGDVKRGLNALFGSLSGGISVGTAAGQVEFADDTTMASVTFRILGGAVIGHDEQRDVYDPDIEIEGDTYAGTDAPLGGFVTTMSGNREVTVSVLVQCVFQDDDTTAWYYARKIWNGLTLPSSRGALAAIGLAVQKRLPLQDLDTFKWDGRELSAARFDVVFNAVDSVSDTPVTTIETFDLRADPEA